MEPRSDYYVYILFRETGIPFYVGKGRGNRWKDHEKLCRRNNTRKSNIVSWMLDNGYEVPKVKVAENLIEAQAFVIEVALIKAIGRGLQGPLVNHTDGGEGPSGFKLSADAIERMRAKKIGVPSPKKGIPMSMAQRQLLSAVRKGKPSSKKGTKMSDEAKAKMSAAKKGRKLTEEHKKAIQAALLARGGPMTGRKHSDEIRAKMSAAHRGKPLSEKQWAACIARRGKPRPKRQANKEMQNG